MARRGFTSGGSGAGGGAPAATDIFRQRIANGVYPSTPPTNWTGTYVSTGGVLQIFATATGFGNNAQVSLNLVIDGVTVASSALFMGALGDHNAFAPISFQTKLTPDSHTFALTLTGAGACANDGDEATLTVLEFA